jgi:8-oxo-dGTP pyrophosphatase MutT (NUDIX family)
MTSTTHIQGRIFKQIAKLLEMRDIETLPDSGGRTRASVAMILCHAAEDLEVLFIQRAADDRDPWSGHIAFPGGKLEEGESVCQAARRETREEIGIDLGAGNYLGRLSDIVGHNLPVRVSCCVFKMDKSDCVPFLSDEVSKVFWVSLSDLCDSARHINAEVAFDDRSFEVPAIRLPRDNKPVLWGITYRLLMQFIELLERFAGGVEKAEGCCSFPESIELDERG